MTEFLYPHMVHEYYVTKTRAQAETRRAKRAEIRTPDELLTLREQTRLLVGRSFGPFPERTPLNARVTKTLERPDHTVETVVLESRPGFPVTANLYIPRHGDGPFPCVLGTCGHSGEGKAAGAYQAFAQGLVATGFLVLVYDPISQGERLQYLGDEGPSRPRGCCQEHNMMGNQMELIGEAFAKWRVWDGIRSLDYLLARPEADKTRAGVTGNSGGGTLSTYLNALDDRFTMAAPSCFVTTYLNNLENELPADSEQIPPNVLAYGLDMADFFVAQIPRPVLLLGQRNDYFDCRGLRRTVAELKRLYGLLGRENDVQLFIGPTNHGYSTENRRATYAFFGQHAGTVRPGCEVGEPEIIEETVQELDATPEGQVWHSGCRRVFDITREMAADVCAQRDPLPADRLCRTLANVLALGERPHPPHFRILRSRGHDALPDKAHSSFAVETEDGIQTILHYFAPAASFHFPEGNEALLHVPNTSSQQEVADGVVEPKADAFFAVDVRGVGQSTALTCADSNYFAPYGADYFYASHGTMYGQPYLGRRVHDLLAVLDLFADQGYRRIHLMGRGMGAVVATYAAVLHPLVKEVTLRNTLLSYAELTRVSVYTWPKSAMAFRALKYFDLPDCYRFLLRKGLRIEDPWDPKMEVWGADALRQHAEELGIVEAIAVSGPDGCCNPGACS